MTEAQSNRFDTAAKTWDQDEKRKVLAETIARAIQARVRFSKTDIAMDLGAGTGLVTFQLADQVKSIYAVDTSQGMLDALTEKADAAKADHVKPVLWDVLGQEDFPEPVDAVVSAMALHHIPDVAKAAGRLFAALKPGGQLAIADLVTEPGDFHSDNQDVHHFGFSEEQLKEWFGQAGFSEMAFETVHAMRRPGADGILRDFPVFLFTAKKM